MTTCARPAPRGDRTARARRATLLAAALVLLGAGCHSGKTSAPPTTANPFGPDSSTSDASTAAAVVPVELSPGQCFDVAAFSTGRPVAPTAVSVVPCARPHQLEAYSVLDRPEASGSPFPGTDVLKAWGEDHCIERFAAYVGTDYARSVFDTAVVLPDERSWRQGFRHAACALHDAQFNLLRGSMRGAAR